MNGEEAQIENIGEANASTPDLISLSNESHSNESTPPQQEAVTQGRTKIKTKRTKNSAEKDGIDLDVDFDNYSVERSRAETIRQNVQKIRESTWIDDLRTLVNEQGVEERGSQDNGGFLPGIVEENNPRVYRCIALPELSIFLIGSEMRIKHGDQLLLEVGFLPKDKDFVVYSMNEELWPLLSTAIETLNHEIKAAKKLKSERQAAFKARFEKQA